jgi:rhodanese-related sulfurtransferase/DNA-binding transcriptional ArsR family regulator
VSSDNPKRELFGHFAAIARALGHAHRLELLEHLGQGEQPVDGLALRTGLAFANVSQHLQHLRRSGLVSARRSGKQIFYRLADGPVVEAIAALRSLGEHNLADVREVVGSYFDRLDSMEPIGSAELVSRLRDASIVLLDVRPEDEYRAGHVPRAINMPLGALEARLSELPRTSEIVAYCRGPYCVLSYQAVSVLRSRGYNVRRLAEGLPEWRALGLPVAV